MIKNLLANAGDIRDKGLIPVLGRSPEGGHGNPLQYSCLENPVDRAWRTIVHGVTRVRHDLATKPPPPPPLNHRKSKRISEKHILLLY